MINEIESKKHNIFNETLNEVNANFQRLYGYIFEGSANLQLENPKDPFNSGLAINIKSPKNKNGSCRITIWRREIARDNNAGIRDTGSTTLCLSTYSTR